MTKLDALERGFITEEEMHDLRKPNDVLGIIHVSDTVRLVVTKDNIGKLLIELSELIAKLVNLKEEC